MLAIRCARIATALSAVVLTMVQSFAQDGTIAFNEKFHGVIADAGDTDTVAFDEVEGSVLTITVRRTKKSKLSPTLELLDGVTQQPLDVSGSLKQTSKRATIHEFVAPHSGAYVVRVGGANETFGGYRVTVTGKPKAKFAIAGSFAMPGAIHDVTFAGRAGSSLTAKVKSGKAAAFAQPTVLELEGPSGALVAVAGAFASNATTGTLQLTGITLPQTGAYVLRLVGANGTQGAFAGTLTVKPPKATKGVVFEPGTGQGGGAFTLTDVEFGRGIVALNGDSIHVVSPLTTVDLHPLTGRPAASSLQKLYPQVALDERFAFGLGPFFTPPIVPRNAVIELVFDASIDVDSLALDASGRLSGASPIQLAVNGDEVFPRAYVDGARVVLDPVVDGAVGFPASPIVVDATGTGVASVNGTATLTLNPTSQHELRSTKGGAFEPRTDLLGSTGAGGAPIGFNPGNAVLDFVGPIGSGPTAVSFHGFLPDLKAPRLAREVRHDGTFLYANGDSIGVRSITLRTNVGFSNVAKFGKGEWADGIVRIRPLGPDPEIAQILSCHTIAVGGGQFQTTFLLADDIVVPLANGQAYQLARAELWEPDPDHPLDPVGFDPANPLLNENMDVANFFELRTADGTVLAGNEMPSTGTISVRFSEPMDASSFQPYESFFVSDDPPLSNPGMNEIGRIVASEGQRALTFAPDREIQFGPQAGTFERIGFGPDARALMVHLRIVPEADILVAILGAAGYDAFVDEGIRGVTDLSGRPLAVPTSMISPAQPYAELQHPIVTGADVALERHGAVVLRFRGEPITGFASNGSPGATYRDLSESLCGPEGNVFGPRIPDIDLYSNGFLAGAPVAFFQKVHDEFNPPSDQTTMLPFATGTSTPIGGFSVVGGARFQHVYRAADCSPDVQSLAGTMLHLRRVSFAPIGGSVTPTTIPDFQIHGGHTRYLPLTSTGGGIPNSPESGLGFLMGGTFATIGNEATGKLPGNYNATNVFTNVPYERQLLYGTAVGPDAYVGDPCVLDNANLYVPAGSTRAYHPLPHVPFTNLLPFDNGMVEELTPPNGSGVNGPHSLLLEYRVRGTTSGTIAPSNGFTYAVGIKSSAMPRFRVFTIGAGCGSCVSNGTCFAGLTAAISPPLDPDGIRNAAGPAPAPPSMVCACPRHPQTGNVVPPGAPAGCTLVGTASTITQLATTTNASAFADQQHNYGDNARYFMVFDYVKKESFIRSPWIRAQPSPQSTDVTWLAPIFDPPLSQLPAGTSLQVRFRTSTGGTSVSASNLLSPEQMVDATNELNAGVGRVFIQFEVSCSSNVSTQVVPKLDTLVVPYLR
ncbi:MAG: hypothetical protein JNL94_10510 [Planctomycetes bacterium]|nr:hypothetical protein [Planctomycetota bacterium]